jgi:hypothetical protein
VAFTNVYHIFLIHSSVVEHLGCSKAWLLWIVLQWIWVSCFQFLWIYKQKWNTGSHGNSIFNFLGNHHSIFHSGYAILWLCSHTSNAQEFQLFYVFVALFLVVVPGFELEASRLLDLSHATNPGFWLTLRKHDLTIKCIQSGLESPLGMIKSKVTPDRG